MSEVGRQMLKQKSPVRIAHRAFFVRRPTSGARLNFAFYAKFFAANSQFTKFQKPSSKYLGRALR